MLQFDGVDPSRKNYIIYPSSHTSLKLETKKFWEAPSNAGLEGDYRFWRPCADNSWIYLSSILWTFGKNTIGVEKSISLAEQRMNGVFWCFLCQQLRGSGSRNAFLKPSFFRARNWLQKKTDDTVIRQLQTSRDFSKKKLLLDSKVWISCQIAILTDLIILLQKE